MTMLTRPNVLLQAWPIIVGQALVPFVGLVDTAMIGRTSDAATLAGVAIGVTIVNLVLWTFGFLRMSVTGLTAQALGASDLPETQQLLLRGAAIGLAIGACLLLLSPLLVPVLLTLLHAPADAHSSAQAFTFARLFGAPAALAMFAVNGWLLGMGRTAAALRCQLIFNGANILFNIILVGALGWGAFGAGTGTSVAEWIGLAVSLDAARRISGRLAWPTRICDLFNGGASRRLWSVNIDIMIRSIALLLIITWFARAGARLGSTALAANHILMQFVTVSSFVLDGVAYTAEARVGAAIGAGSKSAMLRAIRLTSEFAAIGALLFALAIIAAGPALIAFLSQDPDVRRQATALLPYCAAVPLVGAITWQLDGIFIGATHGRALRNAALASALLYLGIDMLLRGHGSEGVWLALLASYGLRAATLALAWPGLLRMSTSPRRV